MSLNNVDEGVRAVLDRRIGGDEPVEHMNTVYGLLKDTITAWREDKVSRLAAALSFFTILSLVPLLLLIVSMVGLFIGEGRTEEAIVERAGSLVGESGRELVRIILSNADRSAGGVLSAVIGFALLVFGATGVVAQLQEALNVVWGVEPAQGGVKGFIRKRVLSFGVVLGVGFLLLVSLGFGATVSLVAGLIGDSVGHAELVLRLMDVGSSLVLFTGLFAFMFKFLPDAVIAWRDVGVGALVTAVLMVVGKLLLGVYLGASGTASTYGAFGALVAVLIWIYYSAQIMFLGAEFTQVYAGRHGSQFVPEEHAQLRPGELVRDDEDTV